MDTQSEHWVTFYRIWHPGLGRWVLVQKYDGKTRTVVEGTAVRGASPIEKRLDLPLAA